VIREPAAELDPDLLQPAHRGRGIADAVDRGPEAQLLDWAQQELVELGRAFLVAPVADPDQVEVLGNGERTEAPHVGGLVPGPDPPRPAEL
jgi:hypothetical protein